MAGAPPRHRQRDRGEPHLVRRRLKLLTGGDPVTARFLGKAPPSSEAELRADGPAIPLNDRGLRGLGAMFGLWGPDGGLARPAAVAAATDHLLVVYLGRGVAERWSSAVAG